jgi:plastocyanin
MQFFSHMAVHSRRIKVRALLAGLLFGIFFNVNHSFATDKQPKLHKVVIEAMKFSPEKIEVNVGDTVVWENRDPFPHNVTANNLVFR